MTLLAIMASLLPAASIIPVHGVIQLSANSSRVLVYAKHVRWAIFGRFASLLFVGGLLAHSVLGSLSFGYLKPLIGIWILVFLVWRRMKPQLRIPPKWIYAPLGIVTSFISLFVGATGPFIAPFFLRDDFTKEETIATKAACQSAVHLIKVPVFWSLGFDFTGEIVFLATTVAAVIAGSFLGKWLLLRMSQKRFVMVFESILLIIAIHLFGKALLP